MFPAFLIQIIIVLIVVGLLLWILQQIPMDATIARIIRVVWLLSILVGYLPGGFYPVRRP